MSSLNLVQLNKSLNEVDYPTSKIALIKNAEAKGADEKILRVLKKIPFKDYATPTDVSAAIENLG
ncbi:MAG: DUF2795 domain-containing protein [Aulosira sp. ZfuVER01]|nr:DUF2795 domain-containing protein [Aulosira sp. ZfuVER01]MDZ8002874.1 DUF2795 domain-containing protein [Aulosira sp. DedVER01a]MDZ8056446.1 DUF2795 domain-containing protein [Aulosira sp. ZfuCHP01]